MKIKSTLLILFISIWVNQFYGQFPPQKPDSRNYVSVKSQHVTSYTDSYSDEENNANFQTTESTETQQEDQTTKNLSSLVADNNLESDSTKTSTNPINTVLAECNSVIPVPLTSIEFDNLTTNSSTSGLCILGCGVFNTSNLTDSDLTNYATASTTIGLGVSHNLRVTDTDDIYTAGHFAGFRIEPNGGIISADLLNSLVIKTYLGGVLQETVVGANLLNVNLLANPGNYVVGFVSSQDFDSVELTLNSLASVSSSTRVYYAVIKTYCLGLDLGCNIPTSLTAPSFPIEISNSNTGVSGIALGSITDLNNLLTTSTTDYATINMLVGVLGSASIAVKDQITDYPAQTYAGFEIENVNLVNVAVLNNISIRTYLNGAFREQMSGTNLLINGPLLNASGKFTVGFVSTLSFDEVQITINQPVSVNLGITRVYNLILQELCPAVVTCNTTYPLVNPNFPVTLDGEKTGIDGLVCVGCLLNNADNVLTSNITDFASIEVVVAALSPASIAVVDNISNYPIGTYAGFTIRDLNNLIELDLFQSITVATYLDGTFQESRGGAQLLNLSLLVPVLGSGPGYYNVGFNATMPFDEIVIRVGSVASVINRVNVYGAFIDTHDSNGGTLVCASSDLTINKTVNNPTPYVGENITFTITSVNNGTSPSTDVVVNDPLPSGYTFVSYTSTTGIYNQGTGVWDIGDLAVGETEVLTIVASVNETGDHTNTATITGSQNDPDPANNTSSVTTTPIIIIGGECNPVVPVPLTSNGFDNLTTSSSTTGICVLGCGIFNTSNLTDGDLNNYATASTTIGLGVSHNLRVTDTDDVYTAGHFAGFRIEPNGGIISADLLNSLVLKTYLSGVLQETVIGANLLNVNLIANPGNYVVGFVSSQDFDSVELTLNSLASVSSSTRVYYAVIKTYCPGPELVCNTPTATTAPSFPIEISNANTGISGVALGSITNLNNLLTTSTTDYATINMLVGVLGSASIAVKDQTTDYPAQTYAGFEIENINLVNVAVLNNITIRTYLNGVFSEQMSGPNLLINGPLLNASGKFTVGFVSTLSFDEVQITINQPVSLNLGITRVYNLILQRLCPVIVVCNTTYPWINPNFPVTLDGTKTGIDGLACVGCSINNVTNVLTPSITDFAAIEVVVGALSPASIAVVDNISNYPIGTFAGFTIRDLNNLIELDLFQSITVATYLNGTFQESRGGAQLINLSLLVPVLGSGPGYYNVGFNATMPFDEIVIRVGSLASVINRVNVFGAFVDTHGSNGGTLTCSPTDLAITKTVDNPTPYVGDNVTFTVTAINNGPNPSAGVIVNDPLPNGYTFVSYTSTTGTYNQATGVWNIGDLGVGETEVLTIVVTVNETGNYLNTATITSTISQDDPNPDNNTATATITPINVIVGFNDTFSNINCNNSAIIGNILTNDTINNHPFNSSDVIITVISNPSTFITIAANGDITVAAGIAIGSYQIIYQICEVINPTNCDNSTTITVTIIDDTAPLFIGTLPTKTIECTDIPVFDTPNVTDTCSNVTLTFVDNTTPGTCLGSYTIIRTWTATDDSGNSASTTQTIIVTDTTAPVMTTQASDVTVECDGAGNTVALAAWLASNGGASASDVCSSVVWTNNYTNITDGCGLTGSANVTFTATDACGNFITSTGTFTIQDTTVPIIATQASSQTVECDGTGNTQDVADWLASNGGAVASDVCSGVTWSNLVISTISPGCPTINMSADFIATDACGNFSTSTATFTIVDTTAPVITTQASNATFECDSAGNTLDLAAWLASNGGASASDLCSTITWTNNYTGLVSNVCGTAGSATVIFTATDACGNFSTTSGTFTIQDTTDPVLTTQANNATVECDGQGNAQDLAAWLASNGGASASDACSSVTWSNNYSGIFTDDCGLSGSTTVVFTATDGCGNFSTSSGTFTIQDTTDPVFSSPLPQNITVSCDAVPVAEVLTGSDACSSQVTITTNETIIPSVNACIGTYSIIRTWTITDSCGNDLTHTQTISVLDTTPPTLVTPLSTTISVICSAIPPVPNLVFTDNCSGVNPNVVYTETTTTISVLQYVIIRTWVVSDNCGNQATFTQTITVSAADPIENIPYETCTNETVDLFTLLDNSLPTNGTWVDVNTSGALSGSIFNPSNLAFGNYNVQYVVANNPCPFIYEININVKDCTVLAACDIEIFNAVSPNGDGLNEIFLIEGIDCYPNNTVEIYNRWGVKVYEANGYNNGTISFNGMSQNKLTVGNGKLPGDTYFYILKYNDDQNNSFEETGYLYIKY